jgi:hypothetical protein
MKEKTLKAATVRSVSKMIIGHGPDNYEELIDLSEIVVIKASWEYDSRNEKWDFTTIIVFKSGHSEQLHLTEKGYEELRTGWLRKDVNVLTGVNVIG